MADSNFGELFSATRTLAGAHMPGKHTDEYFPLEENYADQHQLRMRDAILDDDIDVVGNVNPTGSGKTLSWLAPTIRSGEAGEGWIVLATYPTRALIDDQVQSIRARFEQYYSAVWPPRRDGHTLRETDSGAVIDTGDNSFPLTDRVRSITGEDTIGRLTGTVFMEAFEHARSASRAGVPTVILTTPDMLSVLATDRVKSRDAGQFPGLVDSIVVDEFHLSNPRGKRLLPFHLDVYMQLTDQRFLDTLVFLSATPDAQVIDQLGNAFTTEIIGPDAVSTAVATGAPATREILPETPFHIETRQMFSNGEWLADEAGTLLEWHAGDVGQTVAIVDSVREVEILTNALQAVAPDDLTVGAVSGWHGDNHQATIDDADIVVGNSALEVGVDFDAIGRLVCTAYEANSAIQRIGRMRARAGIDTQEIAVITSEDAHTELLAQCEQDQISRDALQTAFRESISETTAAPYYELLCAAYTRYLWEYADEPLRERVTPQEGLYPEIVRDHFTERLARLPNSVVNMDALWDELEETLETYRMHYRDGGAWALFEEMHDYRPGSLSALILDCTDSDQFYKEYQLGYVLRYGTGRFVSNNIGLSAVFKDAHGRQPTDDELAHLRKIDRRAAGRMILTGTQSEARSYTIEAFNQAATWRKQANSESAAGCFPRRLTKGRIEITKGYLKGVDHIDIAGDVLAQYTPVGPYEARECYHLGPFGNVLPLTEHDSLALWQDATLVHARLISDWMMERDS
ncbi:type I-D CRISPR-associated helicase Cas3' [Haloterrigena alkaliphila]|uniref:Type I-D CRISPR-associated helicase Cas3 n=1 Tax=Haloterrigena alkaliphila TaxID=2816475 RepID=A0A8A2VJ94_9EURY|nr:type I-D CRISPR-associated helicase Cas3' [Haloterrigena alkaliphila]QSX00465.1 type I-D CRISPR-associated helicase Cas3' [Haloterrigena alkaliphila]